MTTLEIKMHKMILFREDVLDYFQSIIKCIDNDSLLPTNNYKDQIDRLIKEFNLINIINFIHTLIEDKQLKKNEEIYKLIVNYSNEILLHDIVRSALENTHIKLKID